MDDKIGYRIDITYKGNGFMEFIKVTPGEAKFWAAFYIHLPDCPWLSITGEDKSVHKICVSEIRSLVVYGGLEGLDGCR